VPVNRYELRETVPLGPDSPHGGVITVGDAINSRALPDDWIFRELLDAADDGALALSAEFGPLGMHVDQGVPVALPVIEGAQMTADFAELRMLVRLYLDWETNGEIPDPARRWWLHTVNEALRTFAPYVEAGLGDEPLRTHVTLYEAAILQLVEYASEGREIRRCANETCARAFTRQRAPKGRSKYGSETAHASGVKYCSHACAKAQSERERRRRRTAERTGREHG
jgi:hypothetical protein